MTTHGAPLGSLYSDPHKRHRATDPDTSREAARNTTRSAATHTLQILWEIRRQPGQTSAELAVAVELERHEGARRCSDLAQRGLVVKGESRTCKVGLTKMMTWWPEKGG